MAAFAFAPDQIRGDAFLERRVRSGTTAGSGGAYLFERSAAPRTKSGQAFSGSCSSPRDRVTLSAAAFGPIYCKPDNCRCASLPCAKAMHRVRHRSPGRSCWRVRPQLRLSASPVGCGPTTAQRCFSRPSAPASPRVSADGDRRERTNIRAQPRAGDRRLHCRPGPRPGRRARRHRATCRAVRRRRSERSAAPSISKTNPASR